VETGEVPEILLSKISLEWLQCTDGDSYNIKVQNLRDYWRERHQGKGISFVDSVKTQAKEVLKYATKWNADPQNGSADFDAGDFVEVVHTTYCKRLFATYGHFRHAPGNDFIGNENGQDIFWDTPGQPRPKVFSAKWNGKAFGPVTPSPLPVFADSDPPLPLIPWSYGREGEIRVIEHPRRVYLRDVARVNGDWRKERSEVIAQRDGPKFRRYDPAAAVERLFNSLRNRAKTRLYGVRDKFEMFFVDTGPPEALQRAALQKYALSVEYNQKIVRAFLEVLQRPGAPSYRPA